MKIGRDAFYGWQRGQVCNYHTEPNGPISLRGCVLMENPIEIAALGGVFVMLDQVPGLVPFRQISAPTTNGQPYRQQSLVPDLVLAGLRLKNQPSIDPRYLPNYGPTI
jgi:hypothetical protein